MREVSKAIIRIPMMCIIAGGAISFTSCGDSQQNAKEVLFSSKYDFTVDDYMDAAEGGKIDLVRQFLQAGMNVDVEDSDGNTALLRASNAGHGHVVDELIAHGADVNFVGPRWDTPLISASRSGDLEAVGSLIRGGAKVNAKNEDNWTPLTVAAYEGHSDTIQALAPKSRESLDEALQLASLQGHIDSIDSLLNHGASVYARSSENRTPLMYAAMGGHSKAAQLLLENGANRFALDDGDLTAANLADAAGYQMVETLLNEPPDLLAVVPTTVEALIPGQAAGASIGTQPVAGTSFGGTLTPASAVIARYPGAIVGQTAGPIAPVASKRIAGVKVKPLSADIAPADVNQSFTMHDYREQQLPLILNDVDGGKAEVRLLDSEATEPVAVTKGDQIGETGLRVVSTERVFTHSKEGKGQMVNVSQMIVEDPEGNRHLVVKDQPATSSDTFALMSFDGSGELYDVRLDDEFSMGSSIFRVVDIRPTQIVIENLESGDTFTVPKGGSAQTALR